MSFWNSGSKGCQPEHPRPQLQREHWISLNGTWDFAIDPQAKLCLPTHVTFDRTITVPFAPETPASGVGDTSFYSAVWYRRSFDAPALGDGGHLLLHFGAVDYRASVWVNGAMMYEHEGGYTPFSVDITLALRAEGAQEVIVRAEDDPSDLEKPRGKQDWQLEPHSIWYPRTTGIWQEVWLEAVPRAYIDSVKWSCNLANWSIGFAVEICGDVPNGLQLAIHMRCDDRVLAMDTYSFVGWASTGSRAKQDLHRTLTFADPGIDDFRNDLLWSPSKPTIIDVEMHLLDENGALVDTVQSYTALRSLGIQGDRFLLNGRALPLRLVLDQGYWPQSGQTAPDENALLKDVLLVKSLGFNGVRKHQKIEDARFHYWADHVGLLVWEEMPSAYRYTERSIRRLTREWEDVIQRDRSHPCIVSWVPFNESWGVPDLPDSTAQRHLVQALYHLTKTLDPTRPVIGNDGWESVATDMIGIHDYDDQPGRMAARYGVTQVESRLFTHERPGGRQLRLSDPDCEQQPIVLTEFGGIALRGQQDGTWGYSTSNTPEQFLERYRALLEAVRPLPTLAGFCYTQFTDTYQEANGLVYADRSPKVDIHEIARATSGSSVEEESTWQAYWRRRLMDQQRG